MTSQNSFIRKIIYIVLIAILMVPLYILSRPKTKDKEGGVLARMREENRLSQARLGEIDPAGVAMSLATFGLRGVASNQLWSKAIEYQKKEDYVGLKATLNQVAKLQPNFVSVWKYQAWNLSYNVSIEFDDFRHRYHWVKKGIDYLIEGTQYNKEEPMLRKEVGWFFSHKIGRADERNQYRRLYRNDVDFHKELAADDLPIDFDSTMGPDGRPDNWMMAHAWYLSAQSLVDSREIPVKNPVLFHSRPAMALIYYADFIEKDGYLDEKGQNAWREAGKSWDKYGARPMATTAGRMIRLNQVAEYRELTNASRAKLVRLVPGAEEAIVAEKKANLDQEQRDLLNANADDLSMEQLLMRRQLQLDLRVTSNEIVERCPSASKKEARRYARQENDARSLARSIATYRENSNYDYWKTRCEVEQLDRMIEARKYLMEAEQLASDAFLELALTKYEAAWDAWNDIFEMYPAMMENNEAEELMEPITRYKILLGRLDQAFPPPGFKLRKLLELHKDTYLEIDPSTPIRRTDSESNISEDENAEQSATNGEPDAADETSSGDADSKANENGDAATQDAPSDDSDEVDI